jgi:hypothetical protein
MEKSIADITLFITSCGRPDLLRITLESFVKYNDYPIKKCVIIDDSGRKGIVDFSHNILPFSCKIIYNDKNLGLIKSTVEGIKHVDTEYVFHCEDDWEFFDSGFIEKSIDILNCDEKIILVGLIPYKRYIGTCFENEIQNNKYRFMMEYGTCGNYTANPSLRKKEIYDAYNHYNTEGELSIYYRNKGKKIAMTLNSKGYVRHIGKHNSAYKKFKNTNHIN